MALKDRIFLNVYAVRVPGKPCVYVAQYCERVTILIEVRHPNRATAVRLAKQQLKTELKELLDELDAPKSRRQRKTSND